MEPRDLDELARYNSEKARGLVHTPEWDARMAEEQARFNTSWRERAAREGIEIIEP